PAMPTPFPYTTLFRSLGQRARQPEPDDLWHEHRERLAEHSRLGFDAADAPAQHPEPVDHRRVRVGADERVRERHAVALGVLGWGDRKSTRLNSSHGSI